MKVNGWKTIYRFICEREQLLSGRSFEQQGMIQGVSAELSIIEPEKVASNIEINLIESALLSALDKCEASLLQELEPEKVNWIMIALTIYSDECARIAQNGIDPVKWRGVQHSKLNIRSGGHYFYTCLDKLLEQSELMVDVLDVYYFCLNQGFVGRYYLDNTAKQSYLDKLEEVISQVIRPNPYASVVQLERFPMNKLQPELSI
ncbi:DotU family type IV/VI secretion system protein [uncultured Shewanella sp.]|uniref:DotU family type IV/VI secretion system protein n=1 Tax=uncultured Shewanella sp. TaxID=173975 RepID=UPI002637F6E8|nr:DotU family type IV/VI secretion system protein [uncultured Shewanella sp.]